MELKLSKIDLNTDQHLNIFLDRCFCWFSINFDAKMEPTLDQSRRQRGHEHEKTSIALTVASEARERHSEGSRRAISE